MPPIHILYTISSHGYGHATRSSQLISSLLAHLPPTTHVTILTRAPEHLFPSSPRISFISNLEIDSGIVQPLPYSIDAVASFAGLGRFLKGWDEEVARGEIGREIGREMGGREFEFDFDFDLILADAPWVVAGLGKRKEIGKGKKIPTVVVSNFTFDAIFSQLLDYLPAAPHNREAETQMVETIEKMYAEYDYVLRLPGYVSFPFVERFWSEEERKRRVIDAPLVFRPASKGREEVLQELGVPREMREWKVLLVQFGGQVAMESGEGEVKKVPGIPEGWICLSGEEVDDERFFTFPKDVYSPDLIGAADVVLGKIGYGTVSECVGMNKALVYVLRPMFAEEPGMLKYMGENGCCEEISVADYESGNWAGIVERTSKIQSEKTQVNIEEGSAEVARIIEGLIRDN
ncbi:hypothetical protein ONS95_014951 [Cadophora gregata]|uniref:uncharacterized protein n=1 Tax=Cadophora gregata TaxID=51156 RepID=UPI0026DD4B73|nr:uncharacterized protein ONS95_014951 [Cadophora gregata]KAK0103151.1 hypothetical protein ONS96_005760 [Cadophora gregata f. sp. sojae]KAK0113255.1 hypothetical protein ONS95_014951 [Cadophora gregata]